MQKACYIANMVLNKQQNLLAIAMYKLLHSLLHYMLIIMLL